MNALNFTQRSQNWIHRRDRCPLKHASFDSENERQKPERRRVIALRFSFLFWEGKDSAFDSS
jgi:hypothetical protein